MAIAYDGETPSSLLLPVVPGVSVPTGLPPCSGLRGSLVAATRLWLTSRRWLALSLG